jgi:hypothetical protein
MLNNEAYEAGEAFSKIMKRYLFILEIAQQSSAQNPAM